MLLEEEATDFIGLAQTGTGKTAAFGLPLIQRIDSDNPSIQALIMAPTRELGQQTAKQLEAFSTYDKRLNVVCVYGGAAISNQIRQLKKPTQVIVATPGRLLDLINRRAVRLEEVQYVVLDEADEMLNMGFKEDIDDILSHTSGDRVTWLFSATMPKEIRRIVKKYMSDPREISIISEEKTNKDITHQYIVTKVSNKIPALRRFLDIQPEMRGVMFCRTKRETQKIADDLGGLGYGVEALHGDLSQAQRDAVMRRFKNKSMQLLCATDVAARGIDVNDLTHVIHHTLPDQLESYTHRSGRTARAGRKGHSIAFINNREGRKVKELEKKLGVTFEKIEVPGSEEIESARMNAWAKSLIDTQIDERAEGVLTGLEEQLGSLSKEDILKHLISKELRKLNNEVGGDLNDRQEKGDRGNSREDSDSHRYFINVGTIDNMDRISLTKFLSEVSNIKRKYFSDLTVQKNRAFFNVKKTQDNGFAGKFAGIEFEGREIRVNRDDTGPSRGGRGDRNRGKKRFGGGGQKRHRGKTMNQSSRGSGNDSFKKKSKRKKKW